MDCDSPCQRPGVTRSYCVYVLRVQSVSAAGFGEHWGEHLDVTGDRSGKIFSVCALNLEKSEGYTRSVVTHISHRETCWPSPIGCPFHKHYFIAHALLFLSPQPAPARGSVLTSGNRDTLKQRFRFQGAYCDT
ncbi:hypothetical protein E2C01_066461 [Portunus trituberculatus]|uniref:Uncharacterized protein n=1 Tax=Portunus trituberculatus TaxID=210409 RepID=A0A5B7HSD9_PORTR|nr:hypothetical protein [Portunus trituberculatus]